MDAGLLNRGGRGDAQQARDMAVLALMIGIPGGLLWLALLAAIIG